MKRIATRHAGFDCVSGVCTLTPSCGGFGSPGREGTNHGRHGEEWHFSVVSDDGLSATSLMVYTSIMPDCTPRSIRIGRDGAPRGADLTTCVSFPTTKEELRAGSIGERRCGVLERACKDYSTTSLGADRFFTAHGGPSFEQSEGFWTALEARHRARDAEARAEHVEAMKWIACDCCEGSGLRKRDASSDLVIARDLYLKLGGMPSVLGERDSPWYWRRAAKLLAMKAGLL